MKVSKSKEQKYRVIVMQYTTVKVNCGIKCKKEDEQL